MDKVIQDEKTLQNVNQSIKKAVGLSMTFPPKDELNFLEKQQATKTLVKTTNTKIVGLMSQISKFVLGKEIINPQSLTVPFNNIEQVMDELIERVGFSLDKLEYRDNNDDGFQEVLTKNKKQQAKKDEESSIIRAPDVYGFRNLIKLNMNVFPFIPIIKEKQFATNPLEKNILIAQKDPEAFFTSLQQQGITLDGWEFQHPYITEIEQIELPKTAMDPSESIRSFTPAKSFVMIETLEQLKELVLSVQEMIAINGFTEIAVDLEHHHIHSYLGLTCLIQITTRAQIDYIIDPFPLWSHLGPELGVIFHNPAVVKVLHGADSDVQWLQRDFGLYLVNLFDTFHACKVLAFPACSLAYLLEYYCKKSTDKRFQLADWSQRPLTAEMLKYAQIDTHYLLYIYDRILIDLFNMAIQRSISPSNSLIASVFQKSKDTSLKTYRKPQQNSNLLLDGILLRAQRTMDPKGYYLTTKVLEWRENLARENDENTNTILPNHLLFRIVDIKPTKLSEIYNITGGERSTHPLIKKDYNNLVRIFLTQHFEDAQNVNQENNKSEKKNQSEPIPEKNSLDQIEHQFDQSTKTVFNLKPVPVILKSFDSKNDVIAITSQQIENNQYQEAARKFTFKNAFQFHQDSEIVQHILQGIQNNRDKNTDNNQNMSSERENKIDQAHTEEYIAFPIIKGEAPQQKQKTYKLFDEDQEPQSLKDKYGTTVSKRKRAKNQEEEGVVRQQIKKGGNNNIFNKLK